MGYEEIRAAREKQKRKGVTVFDIRRASPERIQQQYSETFDAYKSAYDKLAGMNSESYYDSYDADYKDTYSVLRSQLGEAGSRAASLSRAIEVAKRLGRYSDEDAEEMLSGISGIKDFVRSGQGTLDKNSAYWDKFSSAEEYDKYRKAYEMSERYGLNEESTYADVQEALKKSRAPEVQRYSASGGASPAALHAIESGTIKGKDDAGDSDWLRELAASEGIQATMTADEIKADYDKANAEYKRLYPDESGNFDTWKERGFEGTRAKENEANAQKQAAYNKVEALAKRYKLASAGEELEKLNEAQRRIYDETNDAERLLEMKTEPGGASEYEGNVSNAGELLNAVAEAETEFERKYGRSASTEALRDTISSNKAKLEGFGYSYDMLKEGDEYIAAEAEAAQRREELTEIANKHPVISSLVSIVAAPAQGFEYLEQAIKGIGSSDATELDSYRPLSVADMEATDFVSTVRGTVSEGLAKKVDWEIFGTNVASFFYNAGMSMGDSLLTISTLGPGASVVLGMNAAASTSYDIINRGGTNSQALLGGLAAGAAEAFFESFSVKGLLGIKDAAKRTSKIVLGLKQAGIEFKEETLTEIANIISDSLVMGDLSNNSVAVRRLTEEQGLSREDAEKQVFLDNVRQVIEAGAAGALSGGVMGGSRLAALNMQESAQLKAAGQEISATEGGISKLLADAHAYTGENTQIEKLSGKLEKSKEGSGRYYKNAGRLSNELSGERMKIAAAAENVQKAYDEAKGDIASRLGGDTETADAVLRSAFGEELGESEAQLVAEESAAQILSELTADENLTEWAEGVRSKIEKASTAFNEALEQIGAKEVPGGTESADNAANITGDMTENASAVLPEETDTASYERFDPALPSGTVTVTDADGSTKSISVARAEQSRYGGITLYDGEGNAYPGASAVYANEETRQFAEMLSGFGELEAKDICRTTSPAWLRENNVTADEFANYYRRIIEYGKIKAGIDATQKFWRDNSPLNNAQIDAAYFRGEAIADAKDKASAEKRANEQAKLREKKNAEASETAKTDTEKPAGGVTLHKVSLRTMTESQKTVVGFLRELSKVTGIGFRVFENTAKRRADGAPNGWYNTEDGSIWIDIGADNAGERAVMRTIAHELTHAIRQQSPKQYAALRDFLIQHYIGAYGASELLERVSEKQKEARSRTHKPQELSFETALEEIVCDGCEMMLNDPAAFEELAKQDKGLAQRVAEFIQRFIAKLDALFNGVLASNDLSRLLMEDGSAFSEARRIWSAGLAEVAESERTRTGGSEAETVKYSFAGRSSADNKSEGFNREKENVRYSVNTAASRMEFAEMLVHEAEGGEDLKRATQYRALVEENIDAATALEAAREEQRSIMFTSPHSTEVREHLADIESRRAALKGRNDAEARAQRQALESEKTDLLYTEYLQPDTAEQARGLREQLAALSGKRGEDAAAARGDIRAQLEELERNLPKKDIDRLEELQREIEGYIKTIDNIDRRALQLEKMAPMRELMNRANRAANAAARAAAKRKVAEAKKLYQKQAEATAYSYSDRLEWYKEERRKTDAKRRLEKLRGRMTTTLTSPTKAKHFPSSLVTHVAEVLDRLCELYTRGSEESTGALLHHVAEEYRDMLESKDTDYRDAYIPTVQKAINELADKLVELEERLDGKAGIRELSSAEINEIHDVLKSVYKSITFAKEVILKGKAADSAVAAEELVGELREGAKTSLFRNMLISPQRALTAAAGYIDGGMMHSLISSNEIGSFTGGLRREQEYTMRATMPFDRLNENKRELYRFTHEEVDTAFASDKGEAVKMTEAEIATLWMVLQREIASGGKFVHMQNGGFSLPDAKLYRKGKYKEAQENAAHISTRVITSQSDMSPQDEKLAAMRELQTQLGQKLTDYGREWIAKAKEHFETTSWEALDEIWTTMYDFHFGKARNYIPTVVDSDFIAFAESDLKYDATLMSAGLVQNTVSGAPQPLVILPLTDVIDKHIKSVSRIYGYAIPVHNANRLMNACTQLGDDTVSMRRTIREAAGGRTLDMLRQLTDDVQTSRLKPGGAAERALNEIQKVFVVSALKGAISVTIKQAASYMSAGHILSYKALLGGLGRIPGTVGKLSELYDRIDSVTGAHYARRRGLSLPELAEVTRNWNKIQQLTGEGKIKRIGELANKLDPAKWIQAVDCLTTAQLFVACEAELKAQGITSGDADYKQKLAELYNRVIEETQPMYDPLHRSELSKDVKLSFSGLFIFKTQTVQNLGMLYESAGEFRAKAARAKANPNDAAAVAAAHEAAVKFGRTASSQVISAAVFVLMTFLGGLVLHNPDKYRDKDGELTAQSIFAAMGFDLLNYTASTALPLLGGEIEEAIAKGLQGKSPWDVESPATEFANQGLKVISSITKFSAEGDAKAAESAVWDLFVFTGNLFKIPVNNYKKIFVGLTRHAKDIALAASGKPDWFMSSGNERTATQSGTLMYRSLTSGDAKKYESIRQDLSASGKTEKEINKLLRDALKENDARIGEAAAARLQGDFTSYELLAEAVTDEGYFDSDAVLKAIDEYGKSIATAIRAAAEKKREGDEKAYKEKIEELQALGLEEEYITEKLAEAETKLEESAAEEEAAVSLYNASDVVTALTDDNDEGAANMIKQILSEYPDKEERAKKESSIKAKITAEYKTRYLTAGANERMKIRNKLYKTGLYGRLSEVDKLVRGWVKKAKEDDE